jgi:trimeric autotransporter adhesin
VGRVMATFLRSFRHRFYVQLVALIAVLGAWGVQSAVAQTVGTKTPTTTTLSTSTPNVYGGNPAVLIVSVTGARGTPTGTVDIYQDNNLTSPIGTVALSNGQASFTTSALSACDFGNCPLPSHPFDGIYRGDLIFEPSESAVQSIAMSRPSTTAIVDASPSPSNFGQAVTFTAITTAAAGNQPFDNFSGNFGTSFYDGTTVRQPTHRRDHGAVDRHHLRC